MTPQREKTNARPQGKSALARAATPRIVRTLARLLFLIFLATPFVLAFVPWQQTVMCRGMVTAYSPTERMQVLTARVSGQVRTWHVVEGSRVKMNDPVVDIEDNDPDLAERLDAQRAFLAERLLAAREEVAELSAAAKAQESARDAAVKAAKLGVGEEILEGLEAVLLERERIVGISLGLPGDFHGSSCRFTIRLCRLDRRIACRLLRLGGGGQLRHLIAGGDEPLGEEGSLRIESVRELRIVIFDIDNPIVHLDAASLNHVPGPNLTGNPGGQHLHPLGWGICGDHAPTHRGLLPGYEGEDERRGQEDQEKQASQGADEPRRCRTRERRLALGSRP